MPDLPTRLRMLEERRSIARRVLLQDKTEESIRRQAQKESSERATDFKQGRRRLRSVQYTPTAMPKFKSRRGGPSRVGKLMGSFMGGAGGATSRGGGTYGRDRGGYGQYARNPRVLSVKAGVKETGKAGLWTTSGYQDTGSGIKEQKGGVVTEKIQSQKLKRRRSGRFLGMGSSAFLTGA